MRFYKLILLCLLVNQATAQVLIRGPYMTSAAPNSVIIQWQTDIATTTQVRFGLQSTNLNNTFTSVSYTTQHVMKLTGLQAETTYFYSIGTGTQVLLTGADLHFTTLPVPDVHYTKPIRMWAVGDMGKQTQQQINVRESFKQYVGVNPVYGWIMLGDNAYETGSNVDYQNGFFNYYQNDITQNVVLWPTLGNHDYANNITFRQNHQIPYFDIFNLPMLGESGGVPSYTERYYSYTIGNVHFVNLDSYGLELVNGNYVGITDTALSPQIAWLKSDLDSNQMPWVVVSFHHPPYSMGTHNSDSEGDLVLIRTQVIPILERYNVDLVLNGHSHTYERSYFINGYSGMEADFDSNVHIRQLSSGKYEANGGDCPFIKYQKATSRDSGAVFAVVGSGSAIPQAPQTTWPHNAMFFSNYADNGSMLLTVEGNRLDAVWISTDTTQVVQDKFTMFKLDSSYHELNVDFPVNLALSPGWKGNAYLWSTGETTATINVSLSHDTLITVSDAWGCLVDTFHVFDSSINTSLESTRTLTDLAVFPNPTLHRVWAEIPNSGFYRLEWYSDHGALLSWRKQYFEQGSNELEVPDYGKKSILFLQLKDDKNHVMQAKIVLE